MKLYRTYNQIGKAKNVICFHDGKKKHDDGSPFFDMAILETKRKFNAFLDQLKEKGYTPCI